MAVMVWMLMLMFADRAVFIPEGKVRRYLSPPPHESTDLGLVIGLSLSQRPWLQAL